MIVANILLIDVIEQTHLETQEKLINLKEELKSAQRDRACRIEYDSMAKLIKALPDRKQGEECVFLPLSFHSYSYIFVVVCF